MMTTPSTINIALQKDSLNSNLPAQLFVSKTKEWEEEITFLYEESRFFKQLLLQAAGYAPDKERASIQQLRENFQKLERNFLEVFMEELHYQNESLQLVKDIKYLSAIPNNIQVTQQKLKIQLRQTKAAFKTLKMKAFALVKDFIDVKIW